MTFKTFLIILFFSVFFFACAEDTDVTVPRNLQEYIEATSNGDFGEVIACAANASGNTSLTYIFYYPKEGATDIRYYEADSLKVDENDFSKYRRQSLKIEGVFGGKLQRFSRSGSEENWCLVTYVLDGKLHKSNPIRLKNATKESIWTNKVDIEYTTSLEPKFTWTDADNSDIYFQVISKTEEDEFLSGTYTKEKMFQFYDTSNVVLDINEEQTPDQLKIDEEYKFTLMAVSKDNWVNLVIEENLVPGSLQEYLDRSVVDNSKKITSFAAGENNDKTLSYIYYYPLTNARDFRYYETKGTDTDVDKNDLSKYRRKFLTDKTAFGVKLRRFSRTNEEESWGIVTYEIDGKINTSNPIRLKNKTQPTKYESEVAILQTQTLKPKFTWTDFGIKDNVKYFQVITDNKNAFISGIFTKEKTFQYYDTSNTTSNINTETPPELIIDDKYNFTLMGLSSDNWVNLIIQKTFEVE